ncbi:leucine-rich repeat protein, partial [uncultured Duncaniella sp.]|uniref:leucine-rich repeat protein n=1 Tax=uncultured Duncaniella sp. TaxID=2768039 RepID=UPI0025A93130
RSVSISNIENIREGFCERCDNLTSISLSNVKKIGARAFLEHKCSSLSIPSSVTYIGDRAFLRYGTGAWYPYVTSYNPTPPTLGSWVFHDGTGSGVLKVPMGSKPKYKANSSWSKQFDIFEEF